MTRRRVLRWGAAAILAVVLAVIAYAAIGYIDALRHADGLRQRAQALIAVGGGPADLGSGRIDQLLRVEDPAFRTHDGVDFSTPGAGATTITQSLAKRLAFTRFRPGLLKIRQTTYALGLERRLSKDEILALFLDTAEMGRGPDGWMRGMFATSMRIHGRPPAALAEREWLALIAVMIAPARYDLRMPDPALAERVGRIARLLAGTCAPRVHGDVELEGCATR